jgi:hypothetical protein
VPCRLVQGLREHEIAAVEGLSLGMAERPVAGLVSTLHAPSRVGLVAKAALPGLFTAEQLEALLAATEDPRFHRVPKQAEIPASALMLCVIPR